MMNSLDSHHPVRMIRVRASVDLLHNGSPNGIENQTDLSKAGQPRQGGKCAQPFPVVLYKVTITES